MYDFVDDDDEINNKTTGLLGLQDDAPQIQATPARLDSTKSIFLPNFKSIPYLV